MKITKTKGYEFLLKTNLKFKVQGDDGIVLPYGIVPYSSEMRSRASRNIIRGIYIKDKNEYLCEVWVEYSPKNGKGASGRSRSILIARFFVKENTKRKNAWDNQFNKSKEYVRFQTSKKHAGKIKTYQLISGDGEMKKEASFYGDALESYEDRTIPDRPRVVNVEIRETANGLATKVVEWRGKFHHKRSDTTWSPTRRADHIIRRNLSGLPLNNNGDFNEKAYKNGKVIRECNYIKGKKHGVEKFYNLSGRHIDSEFSHHGTRIPRWVYEKPESISTEEILEETNMEVRRAMLELQGFDVFLTRAEKAGMVRVIDKDPDDKVGTLIEIDLNPNMDEMPFERIQDARFYRLLKVKDGTLPKHYVLRVPRTVRTARQANAWTWGKEADEYKPIIER